MKLDSLEDTAMLGLKNTQELPILYETKENSSRQRKERVPRHTASHKGSWHTGEGTRTQCQEGRKEESRAPPYTRCLLKATKNLPGAKKGHFHIKKVPYVHCRW